MFAQSNTGNRGGTSEDPINLDSDLETPPDTQNIAESASADISMSTDKTKDIDTNETKNQFDTIVKIEIVNATARPIIEASRALELNAEPSNRTLFSSSKSVTYLTILQEVMDWNIAALQHPTVLDKLRNVEESDARHAAQ